jgi:hypothetical protein
MTMSLITIKSLLEMERMNTSKQNVWEAPATLTREWSLKESGLSENLQIVFKT